MNWERIQNLTEEELMSLHGARRVKNEFVDRVLFEDVGTEISKRRAKKFLKYDFNTREFYSEGEVLHFIREIEKELNGELVIEPQNVEFKKELPKQEDKMDLERSWDDMYNEGGEGYNPYRR